MKYACLWNKHIYQQRVTGETYKVSYIINCGEDCLLYPSLCKFCGKQYAGETSDNYKYRWKN